MTTLAPLMVEVSVPRAFYDAWRDYHGVEAALRAAGVLPPEAQDVRWRLDVVNTGYVVSYRTVLTPAALAALASMLNLVSAGGQS